MRQIHSVSDLHKARFGSDGNAFQAPGRVNLIGEHTDTSEGFVMPAALDFQTVAILSPREDTSAVIHSVNFEETVSLDLKQLPDSPRRHWSDYPVGVLWSLRQLGIVGGGFHMTLSGNVPVGAGLSSSASLEVAVAIAVLSHVGVHLPKPEIAQLCQKAENEFIGAQSGIMDQFISCCGTQDHALLLDCRSLQYDLLPLPPAVQLVICNSMVKHSVADGEYNNRRADVEQALQILQRHRPDVRTLRDTTEAELLQYAGEMPENALRRSRHVVSENRRVLEAADALRLRDFVQFGQLMLEAHASMRDDYQASCEETDILVELARQQPGCYGARITGAGFGGCTVNIVAAERAAGFAHTMAAAYREATGIQAEVYLSRASDGAGPIPQDARVLPTH
ncbi:MAG TPA: galactokinase [Acidobacteriaceae bacterium]|jgi:galactokinase|nr:galactokinase [Acidobacteriaceae bacterium]